MRQRGAEEAMMGSQVLAGPQLSSQKRKSFPNCLPWQAGEDGAGRWLRE